MKRITGPDRKSWWLPPVRASLQSLEDVLEVLSDVGPVYIEAAGYEFDSLEDIRRNIARRSVDRLYLRASSSEPPWNDVRVEVEPQHVIVRADRNVASFGSLVADIFRSQVKWYSFDSDQPSWAFVKFLVTMTLLVAVLAIQKLSSSALVGFVVLLGFIPLFAWVHYQPVLGRSRVQLEHPHERDTFLERNRDRIVSGTIVSIISLLVGFLLGRL